MKSALRFLLAVVSGMVLAFALVVAVEMFSAVVHPFPADFNENMMGDHVRRYPHWVLGVAALAWGATIAAATWVATRIGGRLAGAVVALLLGWALVFNLAMLPYATWFKAAMLCAFPIASLLGVRCGRPVPSAASVTDATLRSYRSRRARTEDRSSAVLEKACPLTNLRRRLREAPVHAGVGRGHVRPDGNRIGHVRARASQRPAGACSQFGRRTDAEHGVRETGELLPNHPTPREPRCAAHLRPAGRPPGRGAD